MAQRLSCDERVWIEAMRAAGVSVEETARRLGRHRSTVYRELDRNSRHGRHRHHTTVGGPPALRANNLTRTDNWVAHAPSLKFSWRFHTRAAGRSAR